MKIGTVQFLATHSKNDGSICVISDLKSEIFTQLFNVMVFSLFCVITLSHAVFSTAATTCFAWIFPHHIT